jgi:hypothetical protein
MQGKVNVLIAVLLAIVVGISMLPVVVDSVENYDIRAETETFTAVNDATVEEVITVNNTIEAINSIEVKGTELDKADYVFTGNEITLVAGASNTGDEIVVNYDYRVEVPAAVDSLVNLLPILFVVIIVSGAVYYVRFK